MRRVSDWRSDKTASEFLSHDRADLAQEFLCRNSAYEREYHEAERLSDAATPHRWKHWPIAGVSASPARPIYRLYRIPRTGVLILRLR